NRTNTSYVSGIEVGGGTLAYVGGHGNVANSIGQNEAYVWSFADGVLRNANRRPDGSFAHGDALAVALPGDGSRVAWASLAPDIVAGATNNQPDVFVERVSDLPLVPDAPPIATPQPLAVTEPAPGEHIDVDVTVSLDRPTETGEDFHWGDSTG